MRTRRAILALTCLAVAGICQAEDVEDKLFKSFQKMRLCAVRPFYYVEIDPERILELDDDDKYRVLRGDRVWVNEVEVSDEGKTIDIEFKSKHTHDEEAQIDLRLFRSVSDSDMEKLWDDWRETVLAPLSAFVRPCDEILPEESVEAQPSSPTVRATAVHFTADEVTVVLDDGRKVIAPLQWFPRLLDATYPQRADWELVDDGRLIRWLRIDAEIAVDKLVCGDGG